MNGLVATKPLYPSASAGVNFKIRMSNRIQPIRSENYSAGAFERDIRPYRALRSTDCSFISFSNTRSVLRRP